MQQEWAKFKALTIEDLNKAKGHYQEYAFCAMHGVEWNFYEPIKIMDYRWGVCSTVDIKHPQLSLAEKEFIKDPKDFYALLLQRNTLFYLLGCISQEKLRTFRIGDADKNYFVVCTPDAMLKKDAVTVSVLKMVWETFDKCDSWVLKDENGNEIWTHPSV